MAEEASHSGPGWPQPPRPPQPGYGGRVAPPPREAWRPARRIDAVPGTPFGVVQLAVLPVISGSAIGALVAGVAAIGVSLLVVFFGLVGAAAGWGAWAAGAFAVLAAFLGAVAIVLGWYGRRQIGRAAPPPAIRFSGRGLATAGIVCGIVGLGITLLGLALALLLQAAA